MLCIGSTWIPSAPLANVGHSRKHACNIFRIVPVCIDATSEQHLYSDAPTSTYKDSDRPYRYTVFNAPSSGASTFQRFYLERSFARALAYLSLGLVQRLAVSTLAVHLVIVFISCFLDFDVYLRARWAETRRPMRLRDVQGGGIR